MKRLSLAPVLFLLSCLTYSGCHTAEGHVEEHHGEHHTIVVTSPGEEDVIATEPYVCQIHSRRHIEVCALEGGYLEEIVIKEGQTVKQGDLMFKILPVLHQARLDADIAEAQLAQIELNNSQSLHQKNFVSKQDVALAQAKLAKAEAQVALARAELSFTDIKAPFEGIVDRLHRQLGSLIEEGDVLTTLSDNSVMWVYFNVPEARYLEYRSAMDHHDQDGDDDDDDADEPDDDFEIELVLANGKTFEHKGVLGAIEGEFNNETGNIAFRADFPNPNGLLRHGQTGTVLIERELDDALVIPQRATFEILDKRYVFVVDKDDVVHQREIVVKHEMDDIFVVERGLTEEDKIVLEGVRQVRDGDKVEYEYCPPEEALKNLKYYAE